MYYTLKTSFMGETFESGVYSSVECAARFRYEDDSIVPVSDEMARKLILGSIYDIVCVECPDNGDTVEMFNDEVESYVSDKKIGWELLLDYDCNKDNYFVI